MREHGDGNRATRSLPTQTGHLDNQINPKEMKIVLIRHTETLKENGMTSNVMKTVMHMHYARWRNNNFEFLDFLNQ